MRRPLPWPSPDFPREGKDRIRPSERLPQVDCVRCRPTSRQTNGMEQHISDCSAVSAVVACTHPLSLKSFELEVRKVLKMAGW